MEFVVTLRILGALVLLASVGLVSCQGFVHVFQ